MYQVMVRCTSVTASATTYNKIMCDIFAKLIMALIKVSVYYAL